MVTRCGSKVGSDVPDDSSGTLAMGPIRRGGGPAEILPKARCFVVGRLSYWGCLKRHGSVVHLIAKKL